MSSIASDLYTILQIRSTGRGGVVQRRAGASAADPGAGRANAGPRPGARACVRPASGSAAQPLQGTWCRRSGAPIEDDARPAGRRHVQAGASNGYVSLERDTSSCLHNAGMSPVPCRSATALCCSGSASTWTTPPTRSSSSRAYVPRTMTSRTRCGGSGSGSGWAEGRPCRWTKPLRGGSRLQETLGAMDLAAALEAASERDADEVQALGVMLKKMLRVLLR
nr:putative glycosyl transferase [Sorangium cellulosum So0157-2]